MRAAVRLWLLDGCVVRVDVCVSGLREAAWRIQINTFIDPVPSYLFPHVFPNLKLFPKVVPTYLPLVWVSKHAIATQPNVDTYNHKVKLILILQKVFRWVFIALGTVGLCFTAGYALECQDPSSRGPEHAQYVAFASLNSPRKPSGAGAGAGAGAGVGAGSAAEHTALLPR